MHSENKAGTELGKRNIANVWTSIHTDTHKNGFQCLYIYIFVFEPTSCLTISENIKTKYGDEITTFIIMLEVVMKQSKREKQ